MTQLGLGAHRRDRFAVATLAELGLVLAVISIVVNLLARGIVTSRLGAPVGSRLRAARRIMPC